MTQKQLCSEIEKTKASIERLQQSVGSSRDLLARLEGERKRLIVPARVEGDAKSRTEMIRVEAAVVEAKANIAVDEETLSQLRESFDLMSRELAVSSWESGRQNVRNHLQARITARIERRLTKAVAEVKSVMAELEVQYDKDYKAIREFSPQLEHEAMEIRALARKHADLLSAQLDGVISPPMNYQWREIFKDKDFPTVAASAYDNALTALALLEAENEVLDAA